MSAPLQRKVLAAALSGALFCLCAGQADAGPTLARFGTATVNGTVGVGEYGTSCIGPLDRQAGDVHYQVTVCAENNQHYVFFGVHVTDMFNFDAVSLWYDDTNNGHVATGSGGTCDPAPAPIEDSQSFSLVSTGVYADSYYCYSSGLAIGPGDSTSNGQGSCTPSGPSSTAEDCEFSKPLDSGDPDDFTRHANDKLGWCFTYNDKGNDANPLGNVAGDLAVPQHCWRDKQMGVDALHGISSRYGTLIVRGVSAKLVPKAKKLSSLLATCQTCPPGPQSDLDEIAAKAVVDLRESHPNRAARALHRFLLRIARADAFPHSLGQKLQTRAKRLIPRIQMLSPEPPPADRGPGGPRPTVPVPADGG
jgi:hypothetical protein